MQFTWIRNKFKSIKAKMVKPRRAFIIGDRVRYPNHGTGRITSVTAFGGKDFYSIEMDKAKLKILVPIEKMQTVGAIYLKDK